MTKKTTNKVIRVGLALAGFATLQSRATAAAKAKPTFTEDVAPIIYNNCTECHRNGQAAPFTLQTYNDVKKRARLIAKVTQKRFMPPWHPVEGHGKFVDERRLTTDELATLIIVYADDFKVVVRVHPCGPEFYWSFFVIHITTYYQ